MNKKCTLHSEESREGEEEAAQQQQQQAHFNLAAQLAELAARARAAATSPRDPNVGSPDRDARHRTESRLAQVRHSAYLQDFA